jgi:hypothetical protein
MNIYFIIILLIILIIIYFIYKIDYFEIEDEKSEYLQNKILFTLTSNNLNFVYYNNNFYITNQPSYIFTGILSLNGLYLLQNTLGTMDLTLQFNIDNTAYSKIYQVATEIDNNYINTLQDINSNQNKNIYLDPINKVIISNDDSGNILYLTMLQINSPVDWNYDITYATKFNINYIS